MAERSSAPARGFSPPPLSLPIPLSVSVGLLDEQMSFKWEHQCCFSYGNTKKYFMANFQSANLQHLLCMAEAEFLTSKQRYHDISYGRRRNSAAWCSGSVHLLGLQ